MEKLDEVINSFIENKNSVLYERAPEEAFKEFRDAVGEKLKKDIIEEVKEACANEIAEDAKKKIDMAAEEKAIKEAKVLLWNGFLMAFVVGILVNQVTDIISFYKGGSSLKTISDTMVLCVILAVICLGMYIYTFAQTFIKIVKNRI